MSTCGKAVLFLVQKTNKKSPFHHTTIDLNVKYQSLHAGGQLSVVSQAQTMLKTPVVTRRFLNIPTNNIESPPSQAT